MSRDHGGSAAVLAVLVGPAAGAGRPGARSTGLHEQHVRLVRDLLGSLGGREVVSAASDACVGFGAWSAAVDAAITLTTDTRMTSQLAGMQVAVGLDLSDAPDDVAARRARSDHRRIGPPERDPT